MDCRPPSEPRLPHPAPRRRPGSLSPTLLLAALATFGLACGGFSPRGYVSGEREGADHRLYRFLEEVFETRLDRSPVEAARLGSSRGRDRWDDISAASARRGLELARVDLDRLESGEAPSELGLEARTSLAVLELELRHQLRDHRWRDHEPLLFSTAYWPAAIPDLLDRHHPFHDPDDVAAFVRRLEALPALFGELTRELDRRATLGLLEVDTSIEHAVEDSRLLLRGAPFDRDQDDSPIVRSALDKLAGLDELSASERAALITAIDRAMLESVGPAYRALIVTLESLQARSEPCGVWALPSGAEYYEHRLQHWTTLDQSPEEIHTWALEELERTEELLEVHAAEPRPAEQAPLTPQELLEFVRTTIDAVRPYLAELFDRAVAAPLLVEQDRSICTSCSEALLYVPAYEYAVSRSAAPAHLLVDLERLGACSPAQRELLVHRVGLPGLHLARSWATLRSDLPRSRRTLRVHAFEVGWEGYAARLAFELGWAVHPDAERTLLEAERWSALLAIVDTGVHHKRWTRSVALGWLERGGRPDAERVEALDRILRVPGEACAELCGVHEMLRLRERARARLGSAFDLREFHAAMLSPGSLPLGMLEQRVERWLASAQLALRRRR